MAGPRRETRGIVDAPELFTHVHLRLRDPAPALRPHLEHYWLIDWDLSEPYTSHVVPHPSVHLVFQRTEPGGGAEPERSAGVYGIVQGLFSRRLEGRGRVCGVKFRPGAFRPFAPDRPVSEWTGRTVPADEVLAVPEDLPRASTAARAVLDPPDEDARVAALDAFLLPLLPRRTHRPNARRSSPSSSARTARCSGSTPSPAPEDCPSARSRGSSPPVSGSGRSGSSCATASTRRCSAPGRTRNPTGRRWPPTSATATRRTWPGTSRPRWGSRRRPSRNTDAAPARRRKPLAAPPCAVAS